MRRGIHVAVSIDTEADHVASSWVRPDPLRFRSVTRGIPDVLSPLFAQNGVRPTYLISDEVLDDPASVGVLAAARDAELGTHLHGDHVPPDARQRPEGTASLDFACFYPEEIERAKLRTLGDRFRDRFGAAPRAYRAGRYGASGRSTRTLAALGYAVDGSVAPGTTWTNERDPRQTLDFTGAQLTPYRPSATDIRKPGDLPIVEVPITILEPPAWWSATLGLAQRALGRPLRRYPIWLRPSTTSWPWLRWAAHRAVERADGDAWLHVMFHSMEVEPGASPYSRAGEDADRVVDRLRRLVELLRSEGARFHTLSEIAALQP